MISVATSLHAALLLLLFGLSAAYHAHFAVNFGWLACLPVGLHAQLPAHLPPFLLLLLPHQPRHQAQR